MEAKDLRHFCMWLAGKRQTMAQLFESVFTLGRICYAAGGFGAQRRLLGLRCFGDSRLALDDIRALLRCRSDSLRFGYGPNSAHPPAFGLRAKRLHHAAAS